MTRFAKLLFVLCLALVLITAAVFFSLRRNGYLERRISSLLAARPGDEFSFDGIVPSLDLSFSVTRPVFRRGNLMVSADRVIILPRYRTLLSQHPLPERFTVINGTLVAGNTRIDDLVVEAECEAERFLLKGTVKAKPAGLPIAAKTYRLDAHFEFDPDHLLLDDIVLNTDKGPVKGRIKADRLKDGSRSLLLSVNIDKAGPRIKAGPGVTIEPRGRLTLRGTLPARSGLEHIKAALPLDGIDIEVKTPAGVVPIKAEGGIVRLVDNKLSLDKIKFGFAEQATLEINGDISDISSNPVFNVAFSSTSLPLSRIAAFVPRSYTPYFSGRKLFGSLSIDGRVEGEGRPDPTLKLGLAGCGCEMTFSGKKQRLEVLSGNLSIKPGPQVNISGVDLNLSGITVRAAGRLSRTTEGLLEGIGRLEAPSLEISSVLPLLPAGLGSKAAKLDPEGRLSAFIRMKMSPQGKPGLEGHISIANLALTLPAEAGNAVVRLPTADISLNKETVSLPSCRVLIGKAGLLLKAGIDNVLSASRSLHCSVEGRELSLSSLLSLLPPDKRAKLKEFSPTGFLGLSGKLDFVDKALSYSATVSLGGMGFSVHTAGESVPVRILDGNILVNRDRLETDKLELAVLGHLFKPNASVDLSPPGPPRLKAELSPTGISLQKLRPILPSRFRNLLTGCTVKGEVTLSASATGTLTSPDWSLTTKLNSVSLSKQGQDDELARIPDMTVRLCDRGIVVKRSKMTILQQQLEAWTETDGTFRIKGEKLALKGLAALAPASSQRLVSRAKPDGTADVSVSVRRDRDGFSPEIQIRLRDATATVPVEGGPVVRLSGDLSWADDALSFSKLRLHSENVGLVFRDGPALERDAKGKTNINIRANGHELPLRSLLNLLPRKAASEAGKLVPEGAVDLSCKVTGSPDALSTFVEISPRNVHFPGMSDLKISGGAVKVTLNTKGDRLAARLVTYPDLTFDFQGIKAVLEGSVDDLTGKRIVSAQAKIGKTGLIKILKVLPDSLRKRIPSLTPEGALSLTASIEGPPDQFSLQAHLRPYGIAVNLPVSDKTVRVSLAGSGLKLFGRRRENNTRMKLLVAQGTSLSTGGITCSVTGNIDHLLGKARADIHAITNDIGINSLLGRFLGEDQRKMLDRLAVKGSVNLESTIKGPLASLVPCILVNPKNLSLSLPLGEKKLPTTLAGGHVKIDAGSVSLVTLQFKNELGVIKLSGGVDNWRESPEININASSENISLTGLSALLPDEYSGSLKRLGPSGSVHKLVLNITGDKSNQLFNAWADLGGAKFQPANLKIPIVVESGRIARKDSGLVLWKDLKVSLGKIELNSRGSVAGPLNAGSFDDAVVSATIPLSEVAPALGLSGQLRITGMASAQGSITGSAASPVLSGTADVPGKFVLALLGKDKPFRIDGKALRASWSFSGESGVLDINSIEGELARGILSASASLPLLAQGKRHEFQLMLANVDLDGFLKRGADMGDVLSGTFGMEFEGSLARDGGLASLQGKGLADIYELHLNGSRLIKISGWDKLLPAARKRPRNLGSFLLQTVTEAAVASSKELAPLLIVRDVLHNRFDFGRLSATILADKKILRLEPITSTEGSSAVSGYIRILLEKLKLRGLFDATLVRHPYAIDLSAIALKGSISKPKIKITKPITETFGLRDLRPPKPEAEPAPASYPAARPPGSPADNGRE